jgi:hypothetical protein
MTEHAYPRSGAPSPPPRRPPVPPESAPVRSARILEVLARHEMQCVVIGGHAAVLAGSDIVTATSISRRPSIRPTCSVSPPHSRSRTPRSPRTSQRIPLPADSRLLARTEILNLTTDAGDLDVTATPDGTGGYEDLKRGARPQPVGHGLEIAIAALEDIIRSKNAAGAPRISPPSPQLRAALELHPHLLWYSRVRAALLARPVAIGAAACPAAFRSSSSHEAA